MSEELNTPQDFFEDLSGVDGDGLGEGEVAFEGEEGCWEDWRLQLFLRFDLENDEGLKWPRAHTKARRITHAAEHLAHVASP